LAFESPLPSPAGIILFAFFPLAFFGGRWRNKAMLACLAFAVIYLFYWSTIVSTLRYAIVPFAILAVLVAAGAARFYDASHARLVRFSVLVLEVHCLLLAVLAIMIVEVNGPQLGYFGGHLDKSGYLRAALRTYGSLDYLQRTAQPGAAIFGIDNCSTAYAPEPLRFQCVLCSLGGCSTAALAARFHQDPPRYVIVPDGDAGMVEELDRGQTWSRIYRDEYFSVYQLP
jgi:hypothetical protein